MGTGVRLEPEHRLFGDTSIDKSGQLRGSVDVTYAAEEAAIRLSAKSSPADDLYVLRVSLRKFSVEKTVRFDEASIATSMSMLLSSSTFGGQAAISTLHPLMGDLSQLPTEGTIELKAAQGRVLRLQLQPLGSTFPAMIGSQIRDANGQQLIAGQLHWPFESGQLNWDGRRVLGLGTAISGLTAEEYVTVPGEDGRTVPRGAEQVFPLVNVGFAIVPQVDALFMRPVLPGPGITSAQVVFRWQLSIALELEQPTLLFRFKDSSDGGDGALRTPIPASSVRLGSMYLIRPTESLRHGAYYELQVTVDGADWEAYGVGMLRQRNGQTRGFVPNLAGFVTPATLTLDIEREGTLVLSPNDSKARLTALLGLGRGQSLNSVQWRQLSGEPLILDTPQSLVTRVRFAADKPREFGESLLQITVTDSLGLEERARIVVRAGDRAQNSALLVFDQRLLNEPVREFRYAHFGPGTVFARGPVSNALEMATQPQFDNASVTIAAPDGALLTVGDYENVSFGSPLPGRALMAGLSFGLGSINTGRFSVLDIGYASDGNINRLAVDFELSSVG